MVKIRHPFRVPLCSYDRGKEMGDSFRFPVRGILDDIQIFAKSIDTLMMIAVDLHMGTEEGMEKRTGQVIGGMVDIFFRFLMQGLIRNLPYGAMKIQVDELHAFADAENGLFLFIKQM